MTTQISATNHERLVKLSLHPLDYNGTAAGYIPTDIKVSSLEEIFKSRNYSPIVWANHYRNLANFRIAYGFCVDIDGTMTIEDAESILKNNNLNYALVTSRSHTPDEHHFHIFIPFSQRILTYLKYQDASQKIDKLFNSKCDDSVFDGARIMYGSPENAYFSSCWTRQDFDVSEFVGIDISAVKYGAGDWDNSLMVRDSKGKELSVTGITAKTPIFCPWHDDETPSAFIGFSEKSKNWFIYCSACHKTFWKTKLLPPNEDRCEGYWSHSKGIYEAAIVGEEFCFKEIGEKKFYVNVGAMDTKDQKNVYSWLVDNQHIKLLRRIDSLGDARIDKSMFEVKKDEGIIEVHYAPIAVEKENNQFVDDYLQSTFKEHKDFIKQWLAAYCYTNHRPLPTLILVGKRGTGKNTFAEMVAEIYKPLSTFWQVSRDTFNPAYEKKLLIADETLTDDKRNYTELKKIVGQNEHPINKKYTPHYMAKNNMNVVILSNRLLPIFVESSEMPKSPESNQFFVYEFPQLAGPVDAQLAVKLKQRLGFYIRTVLLRVYESMDMSSFRYGMKVPMTNEEYRLFNSSISEEDELKDRFIHQLVDKLETDPNWKDKEYVLEELIPSTVFSQLNFDDKDKRTVVRRMRELGLLSGDEPYRVGNKVYRPYCYKMLDPLKKKVEADIGGGCFKPKQAA
jgi:Family of unknown function (DUF5906)